MDSFVLKSNSQLKKSDAGIRAMHKTTQKQLKELFESAKSKEERERMRIAIEDELISQHGFTPDGAKEVLKKILGRFQP